MRSPVRIIAHRNRSGNISLRLRCLLGSRYHDIATAITLHPSNWDARRQRILPSHPDAQNLNARLNSLVDSATLCIQRNPSAAPDELRKALGDVAAAPEAPDDRYAAPDDIGTTPALPQITNQYGNRILKCIGQLCNIDEPISVVTFSGRQRKDVTLPKWKLLTTHCARRTFVVTALQLDIHIEVISRWTGHSDLKALKPYVAIVDELKARNMAKFNDI